jgi:hypothetical protein
MPWTSNDAETHTHQAITRALKELANERLEKAGDEGWSLRQASPQ